LTELAKLTKLALPVSRMDSVQHITSWLPELKSLKKLIWVDGTDDDRYCGSRLHFSETSLAAIEGDPWTNTFLKAEWQRVMTTTPAIISNTRYAMVRESIKDVEVEFVELVREDVGRLLSKEINKVIIEVSRRN
jgi:hypothetical protein